MRSSIFILASLTALIGCSGSDGTSGGVGGTTGDTAAPTVTLVPSSSSIEGGETIAINATASDAVDGSVPVTLSCTSGTLTGNLLATTALSTAATITCTGTATDKAGNKGTASATISVSATVAKVTPENASGLAQGQFAAFTTQNLPLTSVQYPAKLGDRDITLYRSTASTLSYIVPIDMPAGPQRLDFQIGGKRFTQALTITAAPVIADPKAVILTKLKGAIGLIDQRLASDGSEMTDAQRAIYQNYRTQINETIGKLDTTSAADLNTLAVTLQLNTPTGAAARAALRTARFSEQDCATELAEAKENKKVALVWASAGLLLIGLPDATITKLAGAAVYVYAFGKLDELTVKVANLGVTCRLDPSYSLGGGGGTASGGTANRSFVQALAVAAPYGFTNKQSKSFSLTETRRVSEAVVGDLTLLGKQLGDLLAQIPYVPARWTRALSALTADQIVSVPASEITLGTISNANILGAKGGSGNTISLVFSYVGTPPSDNIDFNFSLLRGETEIPLTGQLVVALPGAEDAALTLVQGKAITSQLQVRGADSIEIVDQPTKGSATISTAGVLDYTPIGQAFGSDRLTYRARNANGPSRTATVLFTINRQFEGNWSVNITSITETQSQPGLCPNENRSVSVAVSKVSDTQYSALYDGFPLNFTMASRDDANGLRATISGTYDDGPGETTENLTVNIPNSSQLNGSSVWSYRSASGNCSGRATITGSK